MVILAEENICIKYKISSIWNINFCFIAVIYLSLFIIPFLIAYRTGSNFYKIDFWMNQAIDTF